MGCEFARLLVRCTLLTCGWGGRVLGRSEVCLRGHLLFPLCVCYLVGTWKVYMSQGCVQGARCHGDGSTK